jgi:hypothetical protein
VSGNRLVQSEKVTSAREIQRLIGEKLKAQYDLQNQFLTVSWNF